MANSSACGSKIHKKPNCLTCCQPINSTKESSECGLCERHIHAYCAEGNYSDAEISKLRRATTPFIYRCTTCATKISKGDILRFFNPDKENKHLTAKHQAEINELTKYYEDKYNDLVVGIRKRDDKIKNQIRDIELLQLEKNKATTTSGGKRPRTNESEIETDAEDNSSIVSLLKLLIKNQADTSGIIVSQFNTECDQIQGEIYSIKIALNANANIVSRQTAQPRNQSEAPIPAPRKGKINPTTML